MFPKLLIASFSFALFLFLFSSVTKAAELCPAIYPVCSQTIISTQDCLDRSSSHCAGRGFDGNYCCKGNAPISTPTRRPTPTTTPRTSVTTPPVTPPAYSPGVGVNSGADIDQFFAAGADYYIAWQYSGDRNHTLPNDQYSFYKDGPTCAMLKSKAVQYPGKIGVNIYSLSNLTDAEVREHLTYVKDNCGASIVRFWGFDTPDKTVNVLNIGKQIGGLKFIVALADFGVIPPAEPATSTWFSTGYQSVYRPHAQAVAEGIKGAGLTGVVYALELINEPHCYGQVSCVDKYVDWASSMSSFLAPNDILIGLGQKASEDTTRGDSPGVGTPPDFLRSNNFTTIGTTSAHYYNSGEKARALVALGIAKSINKQFYIGESGMPDPPVPIRSRDPRSEGFGWLDTPCYDTKDPEYDPLRPYPGSPCDPRITKAWPPPNTSFTCGEALNPETIIKFDKYARLPNDVLPADRSQTIPDHEYRCSPGSSSICVMRKQEFNLSLDLHDAELPVLGNTQESFDDATKVNQYLISYLSGTVQSAQQTPIDKNDPKAIDRLINFSGPLKKLLPFDSQNNIRSLFVNGPIFSQYHNYILGCRKDVDVGYFVTLVITHIQNTISNFTDAIYAVAKLAGVSWEGFLKLASTIADGYNNHLTPVQIGANVLHDGIVTDVKAIGILVDLGGQFWATLSSEMRTLSTDSAESCATSDDVKRLTDIRGHTAPDPRSFPDFHSYWTAYVLWHGGMAGFGHLFDNTSVWASLLQNVPFSTLEDTVGEVTINALDMPQQQPEGVVTGDPSHELSLTITSGDSRISMPHIKSSYILSSLLQSISAPYAVPTAYPNAKDPLGVQQNGDGPDALGRIPNLVSDPADPAADCDLRFPKSKECNNSSIVAGKPAPPPVYVERSYLDWYDSKCELQNYKINPGDTLYGKNITADLNYYQLFQYTPVQRQFDPTKTPPGNICFRDSDCQTGSCDFFIPTLPPGLCRAFPQETIDLPAHARVQVYIKSPWINQIYENLVSGPKSFMRHLLPQKPDNMGEEEYIPKEALAIPGAADVMFSDQDGPATPRKIFFHRLGSLFDFVLGGSTKNLNLQKMLRPIGIGSTGSEVVGQFNETMSQIAARLGVPAEYIDAIWMLETNRGPSGSYCDCTGTKSCGPMAIDLYNFEHVITPAQQATFNRCLLPDAFELAARVLLFKKCYTLPGCIYDPANPTAVGPMTLNDIEIVGRYIGTTQCRPEPQSQCRWGPTVSYCDAIQSIIDTGNLPPPGDPIQTAPYCSP